MSAKDKFTLVKEQDVPELRTKAFLYEHKRTGARFLSLVNDDENKVFGVAFPTPPTDSTGIAHIMEHSVLCGSRKYPIKDPFKQLLGSSVKSFLNAFTAPDHTIYPVASAHLKDFYNLVDVYLDTVFYPILDKKVLLQEGWHYEVDGDKLVYKGVVFNEMKGNYSDKDRVAYNHVTDVLFPNNAYSVDSGGDPAAIPDLTYEQFKKFHETYYHPSNSYAYFYGNDDPEKRFEILEEYLKDFDRLDIDSGVALQPRFTEPRRATFPLPAGDDDKGMVSVNWMIGDVQDVTLRYALQVLGHILTGTPVSPLRKALVDSKLGDDFVATLDPDDDFKQLCFSAGLKGIESGDADKLETLILETLEKLSTEGIDQKVIDAALNTIEFGLREVDGIGGYPMPRGMHLYMQALGAWIHGHDPVDVIAFEQPLTELKEHIAASSHYFEDLIREHFLDNPHRATVTMRPDTKLLEAREQEETEKLASVRKTLSDADIEKIKATETELKQWQEAPDTPEDLAKVPSLSLGDLDPKIKTIPTQEIAMHDAKLLYHDLPTNGIVYFDLAFDLTTLPEHLLPYMTLFGDALLEMGTDTEDYVAFMQRVDAKTGGIGAEWSVLKHSTEDRIVANFFMRGRALVRQTPDLLALMKDALGSAKFDDKERFKQIVTEAKVEFETGVVSGGHKVVNGRLMSMLSSSGAIAERMGGLSYLKFVRDLLGRIDTEWDEVLKDLEEIRKRIIRQSGLVANVTTDYTTWRSLESQVNTFISNLPTAPLARESWSAQLSDTAQEGLSIPAQVNFVGMGANLYDLGYEFDGSILVIAKFLKNGYLWDTVRVQGGAYGGMCAFDKPSGVFTFFSYRDPNLDATLKRYRETAQYLRALELSDADVEKAKIAMIGELDTYLLPDEKGFTALFRYLMGETDERRQKTRDQVFDTTLTDFTAFADTLDKLNESKAIAVLGSEKSLKNSDLDLQIEKIL